MFKILQARLQQYVNWKLTGVQGGLRKVRGTRDQIASICWTIDKEREFQKSIYCFIEYAETFDCVDHNKLWKILKEMGLSNHPTYLLRNLYVGKETLIGTGYGTIEWLRIGKRIPQGCTLSSCLFNIYAEYIVQNTRLDDSQAGIKIARRNSNNLRYVYGTTLMAESEEN